PFFELGCGTKMCIRVVRLAKEDAVVRQLYEATASINRVIVRFNASSVRRIFSEIGREFGGRHHSTVLCAIERRSVSCPAMYMPSCRGSTYARRLLRTVSSGSRISRRQKCSFTIWRIDWIAAFNAGAWGTTSAARVPDDWSQPDKCREPALCT